MMSGKNREKMYGFIQFAIPMEKCDDKSDHVLIFMLVNKELENNVYFPQYVNKLRMLWFEQMEVFDWLFPYESSLTSHIIHCKAI